MESDATTENSNQFEDDERFAGVGCLRGCTRDTHIVVTVLSSTVVVLAILKILCHFYTTCVSSFFGDPIWFWVVFGIVSFLFVVDVCRSNTFQYLRNINTTESVLSYVDRMHRTKPEVLWHIQCYHYETRTRRVHRTDSNGQSYTTTETYQERVNTHSASGALSYVRWEDISVPLNRDEIVTYRMTKVSMKKEWAGDAGCKAQRDDFIAANNRDVYYDFSERLVIDGFRSRLLALVDIEKKPCFAHSCWYLLCHASVVFALPYRMWMSSTTGKVRNTISKQIWTTE